MGPTPPTERVDFMVQLFSTFSPELVEYIFSFTSRDHASAAGLFAFAIKIPPLRSIHFYPCRVTTALEQAAGTGDLPLFRHLLSSRRAHSDLQKLEYSCWNVAKHNLIVFKYLYTLFDVARERKLSPAGFAQHMLCFSKIRSWATRAARFDVLEWLQQSNLARLNRPAFLDWNMLGNCRRLELVQYIYEHARLNEMEDQPDIILRLALFRRWPAALEYLHARGVRFKTWDEDIIDFLDGEAPIGYHEHWPYWGLASPQPMQSLGIFPDDMCVECRETWLPRIGWWGMLSVYEMHGDADRSVHGMGDDDEEAIRVMLNDRLFGSSGSRQNLLNAINEAIRGSDFGVLDYVVRVLPEYQPTPAIVYVAIRNNDVNALLVCIDRYPKVVEAIDATHISTELVQYYLCHRKEIRSVIEVVRLLDTFLREREERRALRLTKRAFQQAAMARDLELLKWAWNTLGKIPHMKKIPMIRWRDALIEEGLAEAGLMEELEKRIKKAICATPSQRRVRN